MVPNSVKSRRHLQSLLIKHLDWIKQATSMLDNNNKTPKFLNTWRNYMRNKTTYRFSEEHTGMESKWESLFPSLPSCFDCSSSAKMLAMVWSSSVSWKLLLKLELELALAMLLLPYILPQLKLIANTSLQKMPR